MPVDGAVMLNAWSSHDVEKVLALYSDDCIYQDFALGRMNRGKEELKTFVESTFAWSPDVHFELRTAYSAGEWAFSEWVMKGTHTGSAPNLPATGKPFSLYGASVCKIQDNKIVQQSDYWNTAAFLQQVGLMPKSP
jgi:steroid delta-isomerase-like uncharacterized protein